MLHNIPYVKIVALAGLAWAAWALPIAGAMAASRAPATLPAAMQVPGMPSVSQPGRVTVNGVPTMGAVPTTTAAGGATTTTTSNSNTKTNTAATGNRRGGYNNLP